jgi:two-component system invasion response regulator UvrY
MFSMHEDPVFVARALDGGAMGYLTKASAPDLMVRAVQAIAAGHRFVPVELARTLRDREFCAERQNLDALTDREFEILRLLAAGHRLTTIATLLCVSGKTVANHQTGRSLRQRHATAAIALGVDRSKPWLITPLVVR